MSVVLYGSQSTASLVVHWLLMKSLPSFAEVYRREGITDWT